jgi:adenylate cyclase
LSLLASDTKAEALVRSLRGARPVEHAAKDLLRAAQLPLLPRDEPHVVADLKRIEKGADVGLAINPNNQNLYSARAGAEISLGRFDEAKSDLQQAIRLSPHDPSRTTFDRQLGDIELGAGRPEAAVIAYRKALDAGDHTYWVYVSLAAAYALLGETDEAKTYMAETLRLNPSFTIKWFREHASDIPTRTEGLRKAGFAEE